MLLECSIGKEQTIWIATATNEQLKVLILLQNQTKECLSLQDMQ